MCSIMKRLILSRMALIMCASAALATSCIYESPDDEFYRTLWKADENPFGSITLDFLCGGQVSLNAENALFDDYGTYTSSGMTATLKDLFLIVNDKSYIIEEAVRNGDQLYLHWHPANTRTGTTTLMSRLSSYD